MPDTTRPNYPNLAFIGKAGAGKDFAAGLLSEYYGYRRLSFADQLKNVAARLWGEQARTNRDQLQRLGMAVRDIEPDTWVNLALDSVGISSLPLVVTDCRFSNEADALLGQGFIPVRIVAHRDVRLDRLKANGKLGPEGWEDHISEVALDNYPVDHTIYNTNLSRLELFNCLSDVLAHELKAVQV